MDEQVKTMYLYMLKYGWHVRSYWIDCDKGYEGDLVVILVPPGPFSHPFRVRLTPARE